MSDLDPELYRKVSAYHEAGHAVAAHVLGLTIELVNIKADGSYGGGVRVVQPEGSTDPNIWRYHALREFIEKYDVMLMAGYPASLLIDGADPTLLKDTAASDRNQLWQDARDAFPHPYDDPWVEEMAKSCETEPLSETPSETVKELEAHDTNLMKAYFAWIRLRAEALVMYPPHHHAIRELAQHLLARETLDPHEAREIIAEALNEFPKSIG